VSSILFSHIKLIKFKVQRFRIRNSALWVGRLDIIIMFYVCPIFLASDQVFATSRKYTSSSYRVIVSRTKNLFATPLKYI